MNEPADNHAADEMLDLADRLVKRALELGADQASCTASSGTHSTLIRRGGKVEQSTQSTTRGLVISLIADDRYSSHSTSDLRPEALETFLERALEATRFLEQDPDRRLPPAELCGRGQSEQALDQWDHAWEQRTAGDRAALALDLEGRLDAAQPEATISSAVYVADGCSDSVRVMSNGFADAHRGNWFSLGGEMTLSDDDGRRPEASAYFGARYLDDLPDADGVAEQVVQRATERLGSRSIDSGTYPMLLQNRVTGRILGALMGPLSGSSLHQGRSCLADRKGTKLGSKHFTLVDDPTVPRGLSSRPWDGDGLVAQPRPIFSEGVLENFYLNVYYGRKLDLAPTTGSRSNWVVPAGERSWQELAKGLPTAILVNGFLGGNSNAVTGDFSFGIRGVLLEHGVPTQSLSEMNVSGNLTTLFERLAAVADDPWPYSSVMTPTLLFEDVQFSGL